jgi:hypothetical protein
MRVVVLCTQESVAITSVVCEDDIEDNEDSKVEVEVEVDVDVDVEKNDRVGSKGFGNVVAEDDACTVDEDVSGKSDESDEKRVVRDVCGWVVMTVVFSHCGAAVSRGVASVFEAEASIVAIGLLPSSTVEVCSAP